MRQGKPDPAQHVPPRPRARRTPPGRNAFAAAPGPADPASVEPTPPFVDEIAQLHADHYVPLVRLAVVLIDQRESAEEVVQDAFLATIRRWDQLRDPSAAQAYLRRAVVNGSRDRLRARRVRRAAMVPGGGPNPKAGGQGGGLWRDASRADLGAEDAAAATARSAGPALLQ